MPRRHCKTCGNPLHADDTLDECVSRLGKSHAALSGTDSSHCERIHYCLSVLAVSFLFRERLRPSRPSVCFLPGICEKKQQAEDMNGWWQASLCRFNARVPSRHRRGREHSPVLFTQHDQRPSAVSDMILWDAPPLLSHLSFCFSCSHIRWRLWRKRIRAPAASGWVCGRTSLPDHSFRMKGEGEPFVQATQSHICTRWTRLLGGWTSGFSASPDGCAPGLPGQDACQWEAGLDSASLRDLRSMTDLPLRTTKATAQAIRPSMFSLIVLEHHLWLTMTEMKEADKVRFLPAPVSSGSLFGPAVEGLLITSRRLRSRLSCDTFSLSAAALPLLPVAQTCAQTAKPTPTTRIPDLLSVGEIEGAHTWHDATPFRSAKDTGPRSPWIRRLRNPPGRQPGRKRRGPILATAGSPLKQPLLCLSPPHLALGAEKSVFMGPL